MYVVNITLSDGNGGSFSTNITLDIQNAPNRNPDFATDLPTSLTIVKTNEPTPWSYSLPATSDLDTNDVVTVSANIPAPAQSFLTFDSTLNNIQISELQDESNTAIPIGTYVIGITLDDGNGGSASFSMTLDIEEAPNRIPEFATALLTN